MLCVCGALMRVVVSSPSPSVGMSISIACSMADISCEAEPSLQEFGSMLFRDPEAIGVFWCMGPASAAENCRRLRMAEVYNPLLAVIENIDVGSAAAVGRAQVLTAGGDDVQPWPIDESELIARLFAIARWQRDGSGSAIKLPGCTFHPERSEISGPAGSIHLTGNETTLLQALASRPNLLISKAMCMLALYNGRDEAEIKIIDVYVCKLRKKIMAATAGVDVIQTVWGQGYRFIPEGVEPAGLMAGGRQ